MHACACLCLQPVSTRSPFKHAPQLTTLLQAIRLSTATATGGGPPLILSDQWCATIRYPPRRTAMQCGRDSTSPAMTCHASG